MSKPSRMILLTLVLLALAAAAPASAAPAAAAQTPAIQEQAGPAPAAAPGCGLSLDLLAPDRGASVCKAASQVSTPKPEFLATFHGYCRCGCSRTKDCNTSADCGGSACLGGITCC